MRSFLLPDDGMKTVTSLFLVVLALQQAHARSALRHQNFVVSGSRLRRQSEPDVSTTPLAGPALIERAEQEVAAKRPVIQTLHVKTDIRYRFATTNVTSRLANSGSDQSREAIFDVQLPDRAFITAFKMTIDGEEVIGEVKEKKEAKQQYQAARRRGDSAGHVSQVARDTNQFALAVNVAAGSKVQFELIYQELLQRTLGSYAHVINIRPGQLVRDLKVDVDIEEPRRIEMVKVPPLADDIAKEHIVGNEIVEEQPGVQMTWSEDRKSVKVEYHPDPQTQALISERGIDGQLAVFYEVERSLDAGEVILSNGYFVHYFAPAGLPVVNKNLMFVLDVSGSMSGTKMRQMKEAMQQILGDLNPGDHFNILTFSTRANIWRTDPVLVPVDGDSIAEAMQFVNGLSAGGGTNINEAILEGLDFLLQNADRSRTLVSALMFLTDGQATEGVTNQAQMLENFKNANIETEYPIFSLAFGRGADINFVKKMSTRNHGVARKIYEDSDASLQLKGFYDEISSPLLANLNITYLDNAVDESSLARNKDVVICFAGGELITSGKLRQNDDEEVIFPLVPLVQADTDTGRLVLQGSENTTEVLDGGEVFGRGIEKMWAYLTIKKLLRKQLETDDKDEAKQLKDEALQMSIQYQFVTPLTSMVAIRPRLEEEEDDEREEEELGTDDLAGSGELSFEFDAPVYGAPGLAGARPNRFGGGPISYSVGAGGGGAYPLPQGAPAPPGPGPYLNGRRAKGRTNAGQAPLPPIHRTYTTTPTTTTTLPPPPFCVSFKGTANDAFEILADDDLDVYIRGHTVMSRPQVGRAPIPDDEDVFLNSVELLSRSLGVNFAITPDFVDLVGNEIVDWEPEVYTWPQGVTLTIDTNTVRLEVVNSQSGKSMQVTLTRDLSNPRCLQLVATSSDARYSINY